MQAAAGCRWTQIVQFDWKVALGDETLTLEELEALARLKMPLVRVRGQWVQVHAEEIQAALDFWKKQASGQATLREVVQMALGAGTAPGGLPFGGVRATAGSAEFLAQLEGQGSPSPSCRRPTEFQGTLRPYQVRGYSWLAFLRRWGLGACLADDMGLGKTIQTLALLQRDWQAGRSGRRLLICPTSVVGNWKKEAERFTPELPVLIHHGLQRATRRRLRQAGRRSTPWSCPATALLAPRPASCCKKVKWARRHPRRGAEHQEPARPSRRRRRARCRPSYRIALTGTPVENHVGDLWSIWSSSTPASWARRPSSARTSSCPSRRSTTPTPPNASSG